MFIKFKQSLIKKWQNNDTFILIRVNEIYLFTHVAKYN